MTSIRNRETGIEIVGDGDSCGVFISDDDFAFIISKMVERMDKRLKSEIPEYPNEY